MSAELNFITALPSEARALIDHYGLRRREPGRGITLYESDGVRLAVSGIGKAASAYAVGVIAGLVDGTTRQLWLNVGIAGHADAAPGTIGIAHRIDDTATSRSHFPAIVFASPCESFRVACFDRPTSTYDGEALCDMESAGFFAAAARCSDLEFVHVLKIVSDNSVEDLGKINRETIGELVAARIDTIDEVATKLRAAAAASQPTSAGPSNEPEISARWRFSATQSQQLAELERRWSVLRPHHRWPPVALTNCHSARDVIRRLTAAVDAEALELGD